MNSKTKAKFRQKGLSLIEASMVLVLSAVVVAGVMVYYQTAQNNNQLDKLSAQIMHIVSEVNGLYAAGKKSQGGTDYTGMTIDTILSAVHDAEAIKMDDGNGSTVTRIKTPFPGMGLNIGAVNKNSNDWLFSSTVQSHNYALELNGLNVSACTKLVSIKYGPDLVAIQLATYGKNGTANKTEILDPKALLSDKVAKCIELSKNSATANSYKETMYLIMK